MAFVSWNTRPLLIIRPKELKILPFASFGKIKERESSERKIQILLRIHNDIQSDIGEKLENPRLIKV